MSRSRHVSPLRTWVDVDSEARDPHEALSPSDPANHPAFHTGRVAVITGAASGIGHAAAVEFAQNGLRVVLADIDKDKLHAVGREIAQLIGEGNVLVVPTDVSKLDEVVRLRDRAFETFGEVSVLLNNAGIGAVGKSFTGLDNWKKVIDVNLWGVIYVQHTFASSMVHQENPSVIINTGSKQGITNPPGNAAYNASKAAVKSLTEGLAHELRENPAAKVTAHLFVPGWTYTGMTQGSSKEKPNGAWTAQQTVQYLIERVRLGHFYIIVPDNETSPELDRLRIRWAAEDIIENRPALSRWHADYKPQFEEYVRDGLADHRARTRSHSRRESPH